MKKSDMNYEKALLEIESIQRDLEEGKVSITDMHTKIKRAKELIEFCKEQLKTSEKDLNKLFE
jgi:exodeoxyribonuclease VII small subunit